MYVRFLETRRIRRQNKTIRFGAGEIHPFDPALMQEFVDIKHAIPCEKNGTAISEEPIIEPDETTETESAKLASKSENLIARKPPFAVDAQKTHRDQVKSGGFSGA